MAVTPPGTLKRKSSLPVWVAIAWRVVAVLALLGLAVGVHWIERDGLKDTADGSVSFLDILYFTSISVTTTGYGDVTLPGVLGKLISIAIMICGVSLFVRLAQSLFVPSKVRFTCRTCGLMRHDPDAVHCKACGELLNIPNDEVD